MMTKISKIVGIVLSVLKWVCASFALLLLIMTLGGYQFEALTYGMTGVLLVVFAIFLQIEQLRRSRSQSEDKH